MPTIKEISDSGPNPNTPTIAQMRDSQRVGSVGKGTSTKSFAEKNALRNQGTGLGEGTDPQFAEAQDVAEDNEGRMPWE